MERKKRTNSRQRLALFLLFVFLLSILPAHTPTLRLDLCSRLMLEESRWSYRFTGGRRRRRKHHDRVAWMTAIVVIFPSLEKPPSLPPSPPSLGRWPPRPLPFLLLTTTILLVVHHPPPFFLFTPPTFSEFGLVVPPPLPSLALLQQDTATRSDKHIGWISTIALLKEASFSSRGERCREKECSLYLHNKERLKTLPPPPFVTAGTVLRTRKGRRVGCCFSFP